MGIPKGGIAFFDSGIGGLTVLSSYEQYIISVARAYKDVPLYYYGDNKRAPYGNLSEERIRRNVKRAFRVFCRLKVCAVVLACNTVTAVCAEELREKYSFPIIGAEPAVLPAAKHGGKIVILATNATCASKRFHSLCETARKKFPRTDIKIYPCEGLAGEIEAHIQDTEYDYSQFLPVGAPDSVVLGCTHYVYIKEKIQEYYGCDVYDGNEGIARRILTVFEESCQKNRDGRPPTEKKCSKKGETTTFHPRKGEEKPTKTKANKRSYKNAKTGVKCTKNNQKVPVFFLGRCRKINQNTYKQMFGVKIFSKN